MAYYGVPQYDEEAGGGLAASLFDKSGPSLEFAEQTVRLGFIRKVFGLLTVQLAITVGVSAAFLLSPPLKQYVQASPWTFWTAFAASLALVLFLSCSESARRQHPLNLICLMAFTACQAVMVGLITSMYDTSVVLLAAGLTAVVTLCLSAYALQTKRDFTAAGGVLFSLLAVLVGCGFLLMVMPQSRVLSVVYAGLGAAVFSCYIVFDVSLMTGTCQYSIGPDDWVLASINIYLDVINLFLSLLRLLQALQDNSG